MEFLSYWIAILAFVSACLLLAIVVLLLCFVIYKILELSVTRNKEKDDE